MGWQAVEADDHRFGGRAYRLGKREIGHVHGDSLVDIPFPVPIRDEVIAGGLAEPHHVLPDSGWVTVYLREPEDIETAVALLARSLELARQQRRRKWLTPESL